MLRFSLILLGAAYRVSACDMTTRSESAFRYREQFRDIKAASLPEILSRLDDSRLAWPLPSTFEVARETDRGRLRHRFLRLALAYLVERRRCRRGHFFARGNGDRDGKRKQQHCPASSRSRRSCFSRDTFNPLRGSKT